MTTNKDNKNAMSGTKNELNGAFNMIKNSKASWFTKTLAFIVFPFVVMYLGLCGLLQMVFYPILYVILTFLYDFELREDVAYQMRKVWSVDYWT